MLKKTLEKQMFSTSHRSLVKPFWLKNLGFLFNECFTEVLSAGRPPSFWALGNPLFS
jgi:hypothetical protein